MLERMLGVVSFSGVLRSAFMMVCLLVSVGCESASNVENLAKAPGGFRVEKDNRVLAGTSSVACAQLQDEAGRAIVGFCPERSVDLTDLRLGRSAEASFAHFGDVSHLRERIALYVPCSADKNAVKVCPGATSLREVYLDCRGPDLLTARNPSAGGYRFDNAQVRQGDEDCQISAPVDAFSTGALSARVSIGGPVDILFVVDNSGSMADEQVRLAQGFERFVDAMPDDSDYRIAVVTTDQNNELEQTGQRQFEHSPEWPYEILGTAQAQCTPEEGTSRACFRGRVDSKIVDSLTMDVKTQVDVFAENVQVGTCGNGSEEQGLNAMMSALTQTKNACNDGFLREEAKLAVIFVSDEDDGSCDTLPCEPGPAGTTPLTPVDSFVERLLDFKPYSQIRIAAIVASADGKAVNCSEGRSGDCGRSLCEAASSLQGSRSPCSREEVCPDNERCFEGECRRAGAVYLSPVTCASCAWYQVEDCCSAIAGRRYVDFAQKMEQKILADNPTLSPTGCQGHGPGACVIDSICQTDFGDTLARIARIML